MRFVAAHRLPAALQPVFGLNFFLAAGTVLIVLLFARDEVKLTGKKE